MRTRPIIPLLALFGLAACGGSSPDAGTLNPFLGTLNVTSAAATNTCATTWPVTFSASGADPHTVNAAVGDCVRFTNADPAGSHQAASIGTPSCAELNGPVMAPGALPFTTPPLTAARTCHWQDLLNPPGTGGGGGGGGY